MLLFFSLVSVIFSRGTQFKSGNNQTTFSEDHAIDSVHSRGYCLTPDCVKVAASVIEAIDLTVDPCDDFYVSIS